MSATLERANRLYEYAGRAYIRECRLRERPVRAFARALQALHRHVDREDAEWDAALRPLRRLLFDLRHLPLATDHPDLAVALAGQRLSDLLTRIPETLPVHTTAQAVLGATRDLTAVAGGAVGSAAQPGDTAETLHSATLGILRDARDREQRVLLVLREYRYIASVRAMLGDLDLEEVEVTTTRGAVHRDGADHVVLVGPLCSFPDHFVLAPRAPEVSFVRYAWIRDERRPGRVFEGFPGRTGSIRDIEVAYVGDAAEERGAEEGEEFELTDVEPVTDWRTLLTGALSASNASDSDDHEGEVLARVVLLEDDHAVFISGASDAGVLTLDIEDVDEVGIERVRTLDLRAGAFVLLRTRGASDYVASVANRILGRDALMLRAAQRRWKLAVRGLIDRHGDRAVVRMLRKRGATHASRQNLYNWVHLDTIHPNDRANFDAMMGAAGLEADADALWDRMRAIMSAHRSAGHAIRNELLRQAVGVDPDEVVSAGRVDFTLPHGEGGRLSAFRVRRVVREAVSVPYQTLNVPFSLEA